MKEPSYSIDYDSAEDMGYTVNETSEEVKLWCAVLVRALKDALGLDQNCKRQAGLHKRRAENWFYYGNEDFKMVCELAGLDPVTVQYRVLDYLTKPDQEKRAFKNMQLVGRQKQSNYEHKEAA